MLFKQKDDLKKTQQNLEPLPQNNAKRKAAYALNLCTVSVSQIIDYNDIYFLEQEYEAILNNLNIQEMPKDETLLQVLKQLLDVITFFRIQNEEKKLLEKEYQQKMKNAIWSAVPNLGLLVTGGNPATVAVSLASQVGIGYMNYRNRKAEISREKERLEWELQRSAIEQFNGLRRELFDTAWRLASTYDFPDEYRITERQISQYNEILMDSNYLRRYKRLDYIKNKFEAYPPFWYYFGNASNKLSQDESLSANERAEYKKNAKDYFEKFLETTDNNLLREDQIEATCALELFDIYQKDKKDLDDNGQIVPFEAIKNEQMNLLDRAKKAAGNAKDILELCAIAYLQINEVKEASTILQMLVNEGYNAEINAQLLSEIYVQRYLKGEEAYKTEYETLIKMTDGVVNSNYLFPKPSSNEKKEELEMAFTLTLVERFKNMYRDVLSRILEKYKNSYNEIIENNDKTDNLSYNICYVLNDFYAAICNLPYIEEDKEKIFTEISNEISNKEFKAGEKSFKDMIAGTAEILRDRILQEGKNLIDEIKKSESKDNSIRKEISEKEAMLIALCKEESIPEPVIEVRTSDSQELSNDTVHKFEYYLNKSNTVTQMLKIISKYKDLLNDEKGKKKALMYDKKSAGFDRYLKNKKLPILAVTVASLFTPFIGADVAGALSEDSSEVFSKLLENTVAIFDNKSVLHPDLIFTTNGMICLTYSVIPKINVIPYEDIKISEDKKELTIGDTTYNNENVNIEKLYELIQKLDEVQ